MDKPDRFDRYFLDPEVAKIARMYLEQDFPVSTQLKTLTTSALMPRVEFIQEELDELRHAVENRDFLEIIDALLDIVVVAKGTAVLMGIRWGHHWDEVHRANCAKERGPNEKRPELQYDLIKPPGWIGPNHYDVIQRYYRKTPDDLEELK